jgi:hypothetical protein
MEIVDKDKYDTIKNKEEYEGVLGLSVVLYNKSYDKAIVLVSFSRGKLSSSLSAFLLRKANNKWIIVHTKKLLVS